MQAFHIDDIVELIVKCPGHEENVVLVEKGEETSEEDRTCYGRYKIVLVNVTIRREMINK